MHSSLFKYLSKLVCYGMSFDANGVQAEHSKVSNKYFYSHKNSTAKGLTMGDSKFRCLTANSKLLSTGLLVQTLKCI